MRSGKLIFLRNNRLRKNILIVLKTGKLIVSLKFLKLLRPYNRKPKIVSVLTRKLSHFLLLFLENNFVVQLYRKVLLPTMTEYTVKNSSIFEAKMHT